MSANDEFYSLDSSSFLTLGEIFSGEDLEECWRIVERLAHAGRVKTSEFVLEEVRRNDPNVFARLVPLRDLIHVTIDEPLFQEAGRLSALYPIMARINRQQDSADPWVIAIAKLRGYKVICEESAVKPQRMATVCTRERIPCGNILDLLTSNGFPRR